MRSCICEHSLNYFQGAVFKLLKALRLNKFQILLYGLYIMLAFLSSAPTNPEARAGLEDAGYNLFRRYVGGVISTWDVLFFSLIFLLLVNNMCSKNPVNLLHRAVQNKVIMLYFKVLALSVVVGLFVITCTQVDAFSFTDWFRPVVPILYLYLTYFLVVNVIDTKEKFFQTFKLFEITAFALVIYGFFRLKAILTGNITTLMVEGIPIILYSELLYFDLPICVYFAHIWCGKKLGLPRIILLLLMIGFILASTRRFNYILLTINVMLVLLVARRASLVTFKEAFVRSRYFIVLSLVGFATILIAVPELAEAIWFAIGTINMFSTAGFSYTGEFRIIQIENIFLNLWQFPITLLFGFGIASKWHMLKDLPTTIDEVGAHMAYDAKVLAAGSDWFPFFHVAYFSTFFRFGVIGCLLLLYIVYSLFSNVSSMISRVPDQDQRLVLVALTCLVFMPILTIGDNTPPTFCILLGLYLGLIEAARLSTRSERHEVS